MSRDLNLVVDEAVRWADVAARSRHAGACLESLDYRDTYRDAERLGSDKKSLLFTIALRPPKARSPANRPTSPRPDRRRLPRRSTGRSCGRSTHVRNPKRKRG